MAYTVRNLSQTYLLLPTSSVTILPGEEREVTEIGTRELDLQKVGRISISRSPSLDNSKDDAKYVEVINELQASEIRPKTVGILNVTLTNANEWYLVSGEIPDLKAWRLQIRRADPAIPFDYTYLTPQDSFMSFVAGEFISADVCFPALYVRCPSHSGQVAEFEYWMK